MLMRTELLNTAHKNQRAETAAFMVLGLAALFAIGGAFADGSDPWVRRPAQRNRGFAFTRMSHRDLVAGWHGDGGGRRVDFHRLDEHATVSTYSNLAP